MNQKIRETIKKSRFNQWEIAAEIGVSDGTLTRWLRFQLDPVKESEILEAIERLRGRVDNATNAS